MFYVGAFENAKTWVKFLILVVLTVFILCMSVVLSELCAAVLGWSPAVEATYKPYLQLSQLVQSVFLFVGGAWLAALLFSRHPLDFLGCKSVRGFAPYVLAFLALFFSQPLVGLLTEYNQQLELPEALDGLYQLMVKMEAAAEEATLLLASGEGVGELLFALFLMAVVPAVGEELFFRGVVFSLCRKAFRNIHVAIWVSALLFSFFHFQFFGFVPRAVLGAMFSYMLVWTGSIWVPMLAHFANNALAVLLYWNMGAEAQDSSLSDYVGTTGEIVTVAASTALFFVLMLLLKRKTPTN